MRFQSRLSFFTRHKILDKHEFMQNQTLVVDFGRKSNGGHDTYILENISEIFWKKFLDIFSNNFSQMFSKKSLKTEKRSKEK
jgi:hypothetical protein